MFMPQLVLLLQYSSTECLGLYGGMAYVQAASIMANSPLMHAAA